MKAKLNFDLEKLKAFFILHVEKFAFAACIVALGFFCRSAYSTNKFHFTPEQLRKKTGDIRKVVTGEEATWKPNKIGEFIQIDSVPYADRVKRFSPPLNPASFQFAVLFNPPIRENKVRREEPYYVPPREVLAASGFGAVKLLKPLNGLPVTGKQWIVVTALVPLGEQTDEYKKKFQNALYQDKEKDAPKYTDFEVERAEVHLSDPKAALNWQPVNVHKAIASSLKDFAVDRPQSVDKQFIERRLCEPLPPLVGRQPDPSMAHPDKIPFVIQVVNKVAPPKTGEETKDNKDGNPLDPVEDNKSVTSQAAAGTATTEQVKAEPVQYTLCRFFDYTVENTKTYCYRVRLVLKNPNQELPRRFLKDPKLAEGALRTTEWSDPSPTASVPWEYRLLAGEVSPPRGLNEAKVKLLVIKWEPSKAVEIPREFPDKIHPDITRGALINYPQVESVVPIAGATTTTGGQIDYITNTMILDIIGGDPQQAQGKLKSPSEMLLMGPHGELLRRSALEDFVAFKASQPTAAVKEKEKEDEGPPAAGEAPMPPKKKSIFDLN